MFLGAQPHRLHQAGNVFDDEPAGLAHLQRLRGVDDVGGRQAEVQPAGSRTDLLGDGGREGDDVVLGRALDFLDARTSKAAFARSSRAASAGTSPASAMASVAASSTASQVS